MKKGLEQKLVKRFPAWFDVNGDVRRTLMPFGFQCGDGWFNILWRLGKADMAQVGQAGFEFLNLFIGPVC